MRTPLLRLFSAPTCRPNYSQSGHSASTARQLPKQSLHWPVRLAAEQRLGVPQIVRPLKAEQGRGGVAGTLLQLCWISNSRVQWPTSRMSMSAVPLRVVQRQPGLDPGHMLLPRRSSAGSQEKACVALIWSRQGLFHRSAATFIFRYQEDQPNLKASCSPANRKASTTARQMNRAFSSSHSRVCLLLDSRSNIKATNKSAWLIKTGTQELLAELLQAALWNSREAFLLGDLQQFGPHLGPEVRLPLLLILEQHEKVSGPQPLGLHLFEPEVAHHEVENAQTCEPTGHLGDDQAAALPEYSVRLADELEIVRAHEGETEHRDVYPPCLDRQPRQVRLYYEVPPLHQVDRVGLQGAAFALVQLDLEKAVPAAQVCQLFALAEWPQQVCHRLDRVAGPALGLLAVALVVGLELLGVQPEVALGLRRGVGVEVLVEQAELAGPDGGVREGERGPVRVTLWHKLVVA